MSEIYEQLILNFLTRNGLAFACPQFHFPYADKFGGTNPDFVVLDLKACDVAIVEVTTSWNISRLLEKAELRQERWYNPLQAELSTYKGLRPEVIWHPRLICFIRQDRISVAKKWQSSMVGGADDVTFFAIEEATFGWSYWNARGETLPRSAPAG